MLPTDQDFFSVPFNFAFFCPCGILFVSNIVFSLLEYFSDQLRRHHWTEKTLLSSLIARLLSSPSFTRGSHMAKLKLELLKKRFYSFVPSHVLSWPIRKKSLLMPNFSISSRNLHGEELPLVPLKTTFQKWNISFESLYSEDVLSKAQPLFISHNLDTSFRSTFILRW